jgi:predicted O-methyltransferase YrrM
MHYIFRKIIKEILYLAPVPARRFFFPGFDLQMSPPQLCYLCNCLQITKDVPGIILEIGCAYGATTLFLNRYLDAVGIDKDYVVIDTFSGFIQEDLDYEINQRGKQKNLYTGKYAANKKKWFDGTMQIHGIHRVHSIQTDANLFDYSSLGKISFCLIDVDLYRPVKRSLSQIYPILSIGGIIVVDDCDPKIVPWDGSDQAYKEWCKETGNPVDVVCGKLGLVNKRM